MVRRPKGIAHREKGFFRILEEKGFSISKRQKGAENIFWIILIREYLKTLFCQQIEEHCDEYEEPF